MEHYYLAVDGGATSTQVHLTDQKGTSLGFGKAGPSNVAHSPKKAWEAILSALDAAQKEAALSIPLTQISVGIGIAGLEIISAQNSFREQTPAFHKIRIASDAHTACLGAHAGTSGSVVIVGTSSIGWLIEDNKIHRVGGWGFPIDLEAGGAALGFELLRHTLCWLDGRQPSSPLLEATYADFGKSTEAIVTFAQTSNSTAFAKFAPLVTAFHAQKDPAAKALLKLAGKRLAEMITTLIEKAQDPASIPLSLTGGLASHLRPMLPRKMQHRLTNPQGDALAGALHLIQQGTK